MQWICEECSKDNRDFETIPLHKFANITIRELRSMTKDDFLNILLREDSANFLYKRKEGLFRLNNSDSSKYSYYNVN